MPDPKWWNIDSVPSRVKRFHLGGPARPGSLQEGSYCKPFMNPCCPVNIMGYHCVDPALCEDDEDCGGYESCQPDYETGWGTCQMLACPA